MITKPRLDEAGDTVTSSGAFTNSNDQPDAAPMYRLLPNAMIGPILSVRAFELESFNWPGPLDPLTNDTSNKPCGHLLLKQRAFLQAKKFRCCHFKKKTATHVDKSLSASSSSAESLPVLAGDSLMLHVGGIEKQSVQGRDTRLSKSTAKILSHEKR